MKTRIKLLLILTTSIIYTMNLSAQQIQCEWSNHSKIGSSSITSVISDKENNSYVGGSHLIFLLFLTLFCPTLFMVDLLPSTILMGISNGIKCFMYLILVICQSLLRWIRWVIYSQQ